MNLRFKLFIWGIILIFSYWLFIKPMGINKKILEIDGLLKNTLAEFKVDSADLIKESHKIRKIRFRQIEIITKTYNVSPDFSFDAFRVNLEKRLRAHRGLRILSWEKNLKEKIYLLEIGYRNIKLYTLILRPLKKEITRIIPVLKKAKVAIVIDDFGYNIRNIDSWLNLTQPITFSILPHLTYSTQIAQLAHNSGKEVILHLPLEAKNEESEPQEKFTITTSMSAREILKLLDSAIKSVPYLKGVSNHQGSQATEDKRVMEIILNELKQKNFYFLDSLVTNRSVCQEIAQQIELKFAKRDIFLDNIDDTEYIKGQLHKLAEVARIKGYAVGIGHIRPKTLEVLKETLPLLKEEGIEFVYLSELVE
ncbi:MAG: divergent polysaccharide deacetylase family protein [Candidatus Omnitrophica bacterium]|nr:divergent polysaccharide deacetylase family protein [Candidatus Omnitrophota bacterium]